MKQINYERTWYDYLTPCPYGFKSKVGEHECAAECRYHVGPPVEGPQKDYAPGDYHRYTDITSGYVMCNFEEMEK